MFLIAATALQGQMNSDKAYNKMAPSDKKIVNHFMTNGFSNGYLWKSQDDERHLMNMLYMSEALAMVRDKGLTLTRGIPYGEFAKIVDRFYSNPDNLETPVIFAVQWAQKCVEGTAPKDLEILAAALREAVRADIEAHSKYR